MPEQCLKLSYCSQILRQLISIRLMETPNQLTDCLGMHPLSLYGLDTEWILSKSVLVEPTPPGGIHMKTMLTNLILLISLVLLAFASLITSFTSNWSLISSSSSSLPSSFICIYEFALTFWKLVDPKLSSDIKHTYSSQIITPYAFFCSFIPFPL